MPKTSKTSKTSKTQKTSKTPKTSKTSKTSKIERPKKKRKCTTYVKPDIQSLLKETKSLNRLWEDVDVQKAFPRLRDKIFSGDVLTWNPNVRIRPDTMYVSWCVSSTISGTTPSFKRIFRPWTFYRYVKKDRKMIVFPNMSPIPNAFGEYTDIIYSECLW